MKFFCPNRLRKLIHIFPNEKSQSKKNIGYTLIELMVVITITSIITGIGVASYNNYNNRRTVEKVAEELRANIRLAQSRAINNEKDTRCDTAILEGWYIEYIDSTQYRIDCHCGGSIYQGNSIVITNAAINNSFSIGFKPLIGDTTLLGATTIDIRNISGLSRTMRITIAKAGDVTLVSVP